MEKEKKKYTFGWTGIRFKKILYITLGILLTAVVCGIYLGDYYRADREALEAFEDYEEVSRKLIEEGLTAFIPEEAVAGLIFYPGGKVEHTAYEALMEACGARGILCVLVEMPGRLAFLDVNAAAGIKEYFPEVERWYLAGHSLGGVAAGSYLGKNIPEYEGLILLGAYVTEDFSDTELRVLSLYGSEDLIMDREKYEESKKRLPETFEEIIIEGGCHAGFGLYGVQNGDGIPAISSVEQILFTAEAIGKFIE